MLGSLSLPVAPGLDYFTPGKYEGLIVNYLSYLTSSSSPNFLPRAQEFEVSVSWGGRVVHVGLFEVCFWWVLIGSMFDYIFSPQMKTGGKSNRRSNISFEILMALSIYYSAPKNTGWCESWWAVMSKRWSHVPSFSPPKNPSFNEELGFPGSLSTWERKHTFHFNWFNCLTPTQCNNNDDNNNNNNNNNNNDDDDDDDDGFRRNVPVARLAFQNLRRPRIP